MGIKNKYEITSSEQLDDILKVAVIKNNSLCLNGLQIDFLNKYKWRHPSFKRIC